MRVISDGKPGPGFEKPGFDFKKPEYLGRVRVFTECKLQVFFGQIMIFFSHFLADFDNFSLVLFQINDFFNDLDKIDEF